MLVFKQLFTILKHAVLLQVGYKSVVLIVTVINLTLQAPGKYSIQVGIHKSANPKVEHLKGASLGKAPALPENIRLGWKGLPKTNTLAYCKNPSITTVKSFIVQWPML